MLDQNHDFYPMKIVDPAVCDVHAPGPKEGRKKGGLNREVGQVHATTSGEKNFFVKMSP
jgi:hypothetical protein